MLGLSQSDVEQDFIGVLRGAMVGVTSGVTRRGIDPKRPNGKGLRATFDSDPSLHFSLVTPGWRNW